MCLPRRSSTRRGRTRSFRRRALGGGAAVAARPWLDGGALPGARCSAWVGAQPCDNAQVVRELKKTDYFARTVVLGSREQMCVNPRVNQLRGMALNAACRGECKTRT